MDNYEKLKDLKDLFDRGLINELEFSKLKNNILFSGKNNEVPIKESENKKTSRTKEELNRDLANGLISGFEYNELCNDLIEKSNSNSNEDHSAKFLVIILVICAILFGAYSIKKSSPQNNSAVQDTLSTTTSAPILNATIEKTTTKCKICGINFSGDGYDKIDGVWQRTSRLQTELCSPNCANIDDQRQTQKYNQILQKHGYAPINNLKKCSTCMGHYVNGFCDMCGAASQERVNQSLKNRPNCEGCNGMGYVNGYNGNQLCPACKGTGKLTY